MRPLRFMCCESFCVPQRTSAEYRTAEAVIGGPVVDGVPRARITLSLARVKHRFSWNRGKGERVSTEDDSSAALTAFTSTMPIMETSLASDVSGGSISPGFSSRCIGCGHCIFDRWYLSTAEGPWHNGCLRCNHCKRSLDHTETCYQRDNGIFCRTDYFR